MKGHEFLSEIYEQVDQAIGEFIFRLPSELRCPDGCGVCCVGFEPEVRSPEARLVAQYMIKEKLDFKEPGTDLPLGTCSFFDAHNPHHCRVYPVRPLVCRCFGFSAFKDKLSRLQFSFCHVLAGLGGTDLLAQDLIARFGGLPPFMVSFGPSIVHLAPHEHPRPLGKQVESELQILYLKQKWASAQV